MSGHNLADYVWGDRKDGFTGYYGQSSASSFATDLNGKVRLPSADDLAAATKTEDKLTIIRQMADVIGVQAGAAFDARRTGNAANLAKSASEVLESLAQVVDGLKSKDGSVAEGEKDPAVAAQASGISSALSSIRNVMDKVSTMTGGLSAESYSQLSATLTAMDDKAEGLAKNAGLSWTRTGTTFRSDPAKVVDILV
jgi:hypothetical protein